MILKVFEKDYLCNINPAINVYILHILTVMLNFVSCHHLSSHCLTTSAKHVMKLIFVTLSVLFFGITANAQIDVQAVGRALEAMQARYDQAEQLLVSLYENAQELNGRLDPQKEPICYKKYKKYVDDLQAEINRIHKNGYDTEISSRASNFRLRYSNEISPIITAYNRRVELANSQNAVMAANQGIRYDRLYIEISLDEFLNGKTPNVVTAAVSSQPTTWTGTGFALRNGYIVTNCHVIDGASSIQVSGIKGQMEPALSATVIAKDVKNDLAVIKINDSRFSGFGAIPYVLRSSPAAVGESIWVLGYPLTQYLGNEIKVTDGIISSKSGYQGDITTYQISAPVQPGNSGGPLFDKNGNILGIVNAGVPGAENVGYAIKISYLLNLLDAFSIESAIPASNTISSLPLTGKIQKVEQFVFLITCSQ